MPGLIVRGRVALLPHPMPSVPIKIAIKPNMVCGDGSYLALRERVHAPREGGPPLPDGGVLKDAAIRPIYRTIQ